MRARGNEGGGQVGREREKSKRQWCATLAAND